jgi:integrase
MASKRRGNGEGSIYRRADGKWVANLTVAVKGQKQVRVRRICKTRSFAAEALEKLKTEYRGITSVDGRSKLADWLPVWIAGTVSSSAAANTIESYRYAATNHIAPHLGDRSIIGLTASEVEQWIAELKRNQIGGRTIQNAFTVLRKAMGDAVRLGLRNDNPCKVVAKPQHESEAVFPFEVIEVKRLLNATHGDRLHALLVLALTTGMRKGELLGLKWSNVDWRENVIHVREQQIEISGKVSLATPKTACSIRDVPITPQARLALVDHRSLLLAAGFADGEMVFPGPTGGHYYSSRLNKTWASLLVKLGLPHRGFHHLRHTFATHSLRAGVPITDLSRLMGHARVSTTLDTYTHVLHGLNSDFTAKTAKMYG